MAKQTIPGGSTFGVCRKMLRDMFTELYTPWTGENFEVEGTLDVTGNTTLDAFLTVSGDTIVFSDLPKADTSEAGRLWNDSGTLKISSGS